MAQYTLKYYDLPGRGEPIRLIFALAQAPYEDVRIPMAEWPKWKPSMPWGQIPVLDVKEGSTTVTIAQSATIARFLAKRFHLAGSTEYEQVKCEELVDACIDFTMELKKLRMEKDPAKKEEVKAKLVEEVVPAYYGRLEKILGNSRGKWFVGCSLTWADAWIYCVMERYQETLQGHDLLGAYPKLKECHASFGALPQIKAYIAKRPSAPKTQ